MKLENDSGVVIQSPPRKSYNPFDSDDEDTNDYVTSNFNYDVKSLEENSESLTFHLDTADLSWEETILAHSQILHQKHTQLFTDKTVTECELPELTVCYKDHAYNSVKDIGIDEGVPTHHKIQVNTEEIKDHSAFQDHFKEDVPVEMWDEHDESLEKQQSVSECEKVKKVNEGCEKEHGIGDVTLEVDDESSKKNSTLCSNQTTTECNKNQSEEAGNEIANVQVYNSKVDSGSIILDFNSQTIMVTGKKEEEGKSEMKEEVGIPKPPEAQTMSRQGNDEALGSVTIAASSGTETGSDLCRPNWVHVPTPASIAYMGPHAHTGSLSLRSESSTGSTRSFAFPVMQAEWNSSPTRMAKANERHEHRGWVHTLLCCRF